MSKALDEVVTDDHADKRYWRKRELQSAYGINEVCVMAFTRHVRVSLEMCKRCTKARHFVVWVCACLLLCGSVLVVGRVARNRPTDRLGCA